MPVAFLPATHNTKNTSADGNMWHSGTTALCSPDLGTRSSVVSYTPLWKDPLVPSGHWLHGLHTQPGRFGDSRISASTDTAAVQYRPRHEEWSLNPAKEGITFLRNVGKHKLSNTASHCRTTCLWIQECFSKSVNLTGGCLLSLAQRFRYIQTCAPLQLTKN